MLLLLDILLFMTKLKFNFVPYLLLFIGIYLLVNYGFYKSYFSHLSTFSMVVHFHGAVMAGWFIYTILLTALMYKGNKKWHKLFGWSSVVLALLIVISIVGITKLGYHKGFDRGVAVEKLNRNLLSAYVDIVYFSLFYSVAIYYRKKLTRHFKYIIAATLVLFGPGIGRVMFYNFPEFKYTMFIASYYTFLILVPLWIAECVKAKKLLLKNDYVLIILMFTGYHFFIDYFKATHLWQTIAQGIVDLLY